MRGFLSALVVCVVLVAVPGRPAVAAASEPAEIAHVAGTTGEGLATAIAQTPSGVAVVGDRLVVGDALLGAIREVSISSGAQIALHHTGVVAPVAAQAGQSAMFPTGRAQPSPQVLAAGRDGSVYVARQRDNQVVRVRPDGRLDVVAGTGVPGGVGDGGPATRARLAWPQGVAADARGAVYVGDTGNHRIRRIEPDGTIVTVAGTGERGFGGDGGPARAALLDAPTSVAVAGDGTLYVVDAGNSRIRRIDPAGTITTLTGPYAGGGPQDHCADRPAATVPVGPGALAVDAGGRLLHVDGSGCLYRFEGDGRATWLAGAEGSSPSTREDGAPARHTVLEGVTDLAVGADGSVYVASPQAALVRRIRPDGTAKVVAGRLQLVRDPDGTVGNVVPRYGSSGDAAPARSAQLAHIRGMVADTEGGLLLAEGLDQLIRRIEPDGVVVRTVAGADEVAGRGDGGPALEASTDPLDLAFSSDGSVYVAEPYALRRIGPDGIITTVVQNSDTGACREDTEGAPAAETAFRDIAAVDVGPDGLVYVAETSEGRVRRIEADGRITTVMGEPRGMCMGDEGSRIFPDPDTPVRPVLGMAVGPDRTVYVTDHTCLWRVDSQQEATCLAPLTLSSPSADDDLPFEDAPEYVHGWAGPDEDIAPDVVVDGAGVLFSDPHGNRVLRWSPEGVSVVAGNGAYGAAVPGVRAPDSPMATPTAIARGLGDTVYAYEAGTHRVLRVAGEPVATSVTRLSGPDRVATAVEVSRDDPDRGTATAVVLARADDFADALAGTPLAVREGGPLLLTTTSVLDPRVEAELRRVLPRGRQVLLLGGARALGPAVEQRVAELGYQPVRIAGADRFATAVAIADRLQARTVFVTTGTDFADALAAGAAAAQVSGAVVLTAGDRLPSATADYLRRQSLIPTVAVGGPAARAVPSARPIVGRTRYQTATLVAQGYFPHADAVAVASGERFPDALAAGVHAARNGAPLLLSGRQVLSAETAAWLRDHRDALEESFLAGGSAALSTDVRRAVQQAVRR